MRLWIIHAPNCACFDDRTGLEFFLDILNGTSGTDCHTCGEGEAFWAVQRAGEVLYVPEFWGDPKFPYPEPRPPPLPSRPSPRACDFEFGRQYWGGARVQTARPRRIKVERAAAQAGLAAGRGGTHNVL